MSLFTHLQKGRAAIIVPFSPGSRPGTPWYVTFFGATGIGDT